MYCRPQADYARRVPLYSLSSMLRSTLLLFCISVFVTGCFSARSVQDSLEDYSDRLSYVLDVPLPELETPPLSRLTDSSTLNYNIEGLNINLREFFALQDCEVGRVVAERNTSLGKSQLPSQRIVYESELLSALNNCETAIRSKNTALADSLNQWQERKRSDFAKHWANLIQTSQEMRLALNTPERLLGIDNNKDAFASVNSLFFLDSLKNRIFEEEIAPIDSAEIETQLQIVRSARLPASLWRTQQALSHNLNNLTRALTPALETISCPNGRASDKAKILRNVFYLFFIEEIQPVGSMINQYHYKLLPLWQSWEEDDILHPAFKRYIATQGNNNFSAYEKAMQAHVVLWQGFLKRCNLSPVAPASR